jgi:hypothetical protein
MDVLFSPIDENKVQHERYLNDLEQFPGYDVQEIPFPFGFMFYVQRHCQMGVWLAGLEIPNYMMVDGAVLVRVLKDFVADKKVEGMRISRRGAGGSKLLITYSAWRAEDYVPGFSFIPISDNTTYKTLHDVEAKMRGICRQIFFSMKAVRAKHRRRRRHHHHKKWAA